MKDTRSPLAIKAAGVKRLLMWRFLSKPLKLILLTEYPKSGGTWLGQMLADYFQVPFPRNVTPRFETSLLHGHLLYHPNYNDRLVCLFRDGRDVTVSLYYHLFFENEHNPSFFVKEMRKMVAFQDFDAIRDNMPAFLEQVFNGPIKKRLHFSWSEFVDSCYPQDIAKVRYEDLLADATAAMRPVVEKLSGKPADMQRLEAIAAQYSFSKQVKQHQDGSFSKSFLRKGQAGDWKNHFNREACEIFDHYAGKQLIQLGYEQNHEWVNTTDILVP